MINLIITLSVMCGLFTLFFISPALMSIGLIKVSSDNYKVSIEEKLLSSIPIFNYFYGWKKYSGSVISLTGISSILLIIAISIRYYVMYFMYGNDVVQIFTIYLLLAAILLFWIMSAVDIFRVLSDSGIYTLSSKIVYSASVLVGQITIGVYMPSKMKYYLQKKGDSLYGRS